MKFNCLATILIVLLFTGAVTNAQIVLGPPDVSGSVFEHSGTCRHRYQYATNWSYYHQWGYPETDTISDVRAGNWTSTNINYAHPPAYETRQQIFYHNTQAIFEFGLDATIDGGQFPKSSMTAYNWEAQLTGMVVGVQAWQVGRNQPVVLNDMSVDNQDGELTVNDIENYEQIGTVFNEIPENGSSLSIDITEALRKDIFGDDGSQDFSGFILSDVSEDATHFIRFDADLPRIVINFVGPTPTATSTPTPRETPTPVPWRGVEFICPDKELSGGDLFRLRAQCMGPRDQKEADLYVILDVYGSYWFYPDWTIEPGYQTVVLNASHPVVVFLLDFVWPDDVFGAAYGLKFWGGILDPDTERLIGDPDMVEFGYY